MLGSGEQMIMRTSNECRAMACEMERKAQSCPTCELETEFLDLAKAWRGIALMAEWQDAAERRIWPR
jgi:hypothetical protein